MNAIVEERQQQGTANKSVLKLKASTIHHEGALLACAKLGLWQEAFEIYRGIVDSDEASADDVEESTDEDKTNVMALTKITDSMISSLVKACVRGSKRKSKALLAVEERRVPLDEAVRLLQNVEVR